MKKLYFELLNFQLNHIHNHYSTKKMIVAIPDIVPGYMLKKQAI